MKDSRVNVSHIQPLIPAIFLFILGFFQPWGLIGDVICLTLALICFFIGLFNMKSRVSEYNRIKEAHAIQSMIRHQRHDWLNHIQVIMGYQTLNQSEKIADYLQKMMRTANEDRKITDIDFPPLSAKLLTINYDYPAWDWQIIMDDRMSSVGIHNERKLFELLQFFLPWFIEQLKEEKAWVKVRFTLSLEEEVIHLALSCHAEEERETTHVMDTRVIELNQWAATCQWSTDAQQCSIYMPVESI